MNSRTDPFPVAVNYTKNRPLSGCSVWYGGEAPWSGCVEDPKHPYRFVFIDGCNSAATVLPEAFGITKWMDDEACAKNGIPPRAFVGWNSVKVVGLARAQMNQNHKQFIEDFFHIWADETDPKTGKYYTLQQAIDKAMVGKSLKRPVIYGCKNLLFHPWR